MDKLFTADDLAVMDAVRDVFNPTHRLSPQKMLPTAGGCGTESFARTSPGRRAAL